jgi:hypothetical protein
VAQALPAARGGWRVWEAEEEEGAVRTGGVAVETGRERGGWQRQPCARLSTRPVAA